MGRAQNRQLWGLQASAAAQVGIWCSCRGLEEGRTTLEDCTAHYTPCTPHSCSYTAPRWIVHTAWETLRLVSVSSGWPSCPQTQHTALQQKQPRFSSEQSHNTRGNRLQHHLPGSCAPFTERCSAQRLRNLIHTEVGGRGACCGVRALMLISLLCGSRAPAPLRAGRSAPRSPPLPLLEALGPSMGEGCTLYTSPLNCYTFLPCSLDRGLCYQQAGEKLPSGTACAFQTDG